MPAEIVVISALIATVLVDKVSKPKIDEEKIIKVICEDFCDNKRLCEVYCTLVVDTAKALKKNLINKPGKGGGSEDKRTF